MTISRGISSIPLLERPTYTHTYTLRFWNGVWVECLKEEYCNDAPPTIGLDTFRGGRAFVSDRGKTAKTEAPSGMVWSIPWPVLGGSHCIIVLHMWMTHARLSEGVSPVPFFGWSYWKAPPFDSGRFSTVSGRLGETHARVLRTGAYQACSINFKWDFTIDCWPVRRVVRWFLYSNWFSHPNDQMGVSNNMGTPGCHIDNHQIWIISPPLPIFGKLPKESNGDASNRWCARSFRCRIFMMSLEDLSACSRPWCTEIGTWWTWRT